LLKVYERFDNNDWPIADPETVQSHSKTIRHMSTLRKYVYFVKIRKIDSMNANNINNRFKDNNTI